MPATRTDPLLAGHMLTDEDWAWVNAHLALANSPRRIGEPERRHLKCGHQVGGPFDTGLRDCDICNRYLLDAVAGL